LRQRERLGYYSTLLPELRECDKVKLTNFIRMDWSKFNELLSLVEPLITKKRTKFRSVNFVYYLIYGAQIWRITELRKRSITQGSGSILCGQTDASRWQ